MRGGGVGQVVIEAGFVDVRARSWIDTLVSITTYPPLPESHPHSHSVRGVVYTSIGPVCRSTKRGMSSTYPSKLHSLISTLSIQTQERLFWGSKEDRSWSFLCLDLASVMVRLTPIKKRGWGKIQENLGHGLRQTSRGMMSPVSRTHWGLVLKHVRGKPLRSPRIKRSPRALRLRWWRT